MVDELLAFDETGVDELVVVFESGASVAPHDEQMERFHEQVITPYRQALRELADSLREQSSM
jgi:hypothetical protein